MMESAFPARDLLRRIAAAGIATAVIDGLFASALSVLAYDSTVTRMFQGIASTLVGRSAYDGGTRTAVIGALMHVGVAFGWSAVFVLAFARWHRLRTLVASPLGTLKVASVYGPAIWLVMSLLVIPALVGRPPAISVRWWVQLLGHVVFVGIPIVAFASRESTGRVR